MRVLVADDNRDNAVTLQQLLQLNGHDAHYCLRGEDVIQRVDQLRPDVLLLDLSMPQMSGFDVAEEFRRRPDIRPRSVVAVTGHGEPDNQDKAAATGFDFFLLKPVTWGILEEVLQSVADSS